MIARLHAQTHLAGRRIPCALVALVLSAWLEGSAAAQPTDIPVPPLAGDRDARDERVDRVEKRLKAMERALVEASQKLKKSASPPQSLVNSSIGFSFADNNVLRGAGETRKNSPSGFVGQDVPTTLDRVVPSNYLPSLAHVGAYARIDEGGAVVGDGALFLRLPLDPRTGAGSISDYGSYIRIARFLNAERNRRLSATFFPYDADRFRLGFHYDISWGGTEVFPRNIRTGQSPGLRFDWDIGSAYAFVGGKTALLRAPTPRVLNNQGGNTTEYVERAFYGLLGGAGVEALRGLKLEANGGYFQKGTNTRQSVLGKPIYAGGGSVHVGYDKGLPIGRRINMGLYQIDPFMLDVLAPENYDAGTAFNVRGEFTYVIQTLEDPSRPASTKNEAAKAAMITAAFRTGATRFLFDVVYRDLTFITFNQTGFIPQQALPDGVSVKPETFLAFSVDHYLGEATGLTPTLTAGLLLPATYKGVMPAGMQQSEDTAGIRKAVVRGPNSLDWDILPTGEDERPVVFTKVGLKWNHTRRLAALVEASYGYDHNTSVVLRNDSGHAVRTFDNPHVLGLGFVSRLTF